MILELQASEMENKWKRLQDTEADRQVKLTLRAQVVPEQIKLRRSELIMILQMIKIRVNCNLDPNGL